MSYPRWKYHVELEPVIVKHEEEESSLGEEWADSPADHGIITHPSKEQAQAAKLTAVPAESAEKRKPGRPRKEE